ncbi:MAG TPA: hypothetical protein PL187_17875, partial [Caldilinea sp.]|nr:hypothetical protein [Caldilinea sp.]
MRQLLVFRTPDIDSAFTRACGQIATIGAEACGVDKAKGFGEDAVDDLGPCKVGLGQAHPAQTELSKMESRKIITSRVYVQ